MVLGGEAGVCEVAYGCLSASLFVVFLLVMMSWCKGIMPKFNTSEWGVLGEGWERVLARSKQTRRSQ